MYGLDFARDMLEDAARRRACTPSLRGGAAVEWVQGDALDLPFEDSAFDAATMGYGLRNVADVGRALRELRLVVRPGGRAVVLDFNNSENGVVDWAQEQLLERVVVPAAAELGVEKEYRYLRPSIKKFPTGEEGDGRYYVAVLIK